MLAGDGDLVREAVRLQQLAREALYAAVVAERDAGTWWETIGDALGITKSSAHTRFSKIVQSMKGYGQPAVDDAWSEVRELLAARDEKAQLRELYGAVNEAIYGKEG